MSLGSQIEKARTERGMTQKQLAEYLRVKQATVSMIEEGSLEPGEGLEKLLRTWLASGAGPRKKPARGPYKARSTLPER